MNHIDQRLLEMKLRLECSGADTGVVSRVWGAIENLDFGGLNLDELVVYRSILSKEDRMLWIKYGGSQYADEELQFQQASFKLELVRRMDTSDEEVDIPVHTKRGGEVMFERRTRSAFDTAMMEKFGSDWELQLKNPRGAQSSGTMKSITGAKDEDGNEKFMSMGRQHGRTLVSLKPIEVAKHPDIEVATETGEVITVLVHEPLETSIECGIMLKETFEALKVISISSGSSNSQAQESGGKNAGNGNMASGKGEREVFMVGLVEHVRHRQCRCSDGWINVDGEPHDLRGRWNSAYSALLAYSMEMDDYSVMEGFLADHPNPLESYYAWKFPSKDPKKLAANAQAGVSASRLTKNGTAPRFYVPKLDAARQSQNCERWIQWNLDDQIRKLLGGKKNNSVENLVSDNDVSDYYDEIYTDSDGNEWTYLEYARKMLAKSWVTSTKNANREIRKQGEQNVGKMYRSKSGKLRSGDKSCTVNGARCNVLTESTIHLEITAPDSELNGFSGIVDAKELVTKFTELEFNWEQFALEEYEAGFTTGKTTPTKDDLDRMIKNYMIRLNDLSIESVFMDGDSPWLNIREHCFPEGVVVLARCVNTDELSRLQRARQIVEDCGMDTEDVKQILSAFRRPKQYLKMFFEGEVRNQIWAGLK